MFKKLSTIAHCLIFLLTISIFLNIAKADQYKNQKEILYKDIIFNRSFAYFQGGIGTDIASSLFLSFTQYNTTKKIYETSTYNLTGSFNINPTIIFGFYNVNHHIGFEAEYGRDVLYENKLDGNSTVGNRDKAYVYMNYFLFNVKKDIFNLWQHNIFYVAVGGGVGLVTLPEESQNTNKPEIILQPGFGMYHQINNNIDIILEYKYKINLATSATMTSGIKQIFRLKQNIIMASIRFKI